jgi:hypothetical protein
MLTLAYGLSKKKRFVVLDVPAATPPFGALERAIRGRDEGYRMRRSRALI